MRYYHYKDINELAKGYGYNNIALVGKDYFLATDTINRKLVLVYVTTIGDKLTIDNTRDTVEFKDSREAIDYYNNLISSVHSE